jgi:hypothetical protein
MAVLAKVFLQDHPSSSYFAELEEISSAACRGSTAQENSPPPPQSVTLAGGGVGL